MTEDQILDKILLEICRFDGSQFFVANFVIELLNNDDAPYNKYIDRLEALGLATPKEPRHAMVITDHGRQVVKNGGWLKHINQKMVEKFKADDKVALETELTVSSIVSTRLNDKMSKANFWFGIINVLGLIINLILMLISVGIIKL